MLIKNFKANNKWNEHNRHILFLVVEMMEMNNTFFSKFSSQVSQPKSENKTKLYSCFHDLIVSPVPYSGRQTLPKNQKQIIEEQHQRFTNPKTSFYLCKKCDTSQQFQKMPMCVMKRLAYRKQNKQDQWGRIIYNDNQSKNYDQVTTQFHCLSLLQGSHRVIQLISVLHQNTRAKEDIKFFYHFLKLADRRSRGIRNICFVLQEMNEGSLKEQIDKIMNKKRQPYCQTQIIQYTCQIAEGLIQLRSKGIIHRDLRPENILIHNGQLKFADFDSAFINGFSDSRNIKNGVDMKDTTPLEIMLLIAQSDEKLKALTSQELFQLQAKADIYFLGVNIYSMVFSQPFQSFNGGRILNNLINIKKRSGFCPKLLDLMSQCLQKNSHVRIDLNDVIKSLIQIQRQTYLKHSDYTHIYLGVEPLNLYSFSTNQMNIKLKQSQIQNQQSQAYHNRIELDKYFQNKLRIATVQRNTHRYQPTVRYMLQNMDQEAIWLDNDRSISIKQEQQKLRNKVQLFLERMQIKAYYYQFAYRIICEVNLDLVKSVTHRQNIRSHLQLFSNQLIILLTFIYDELMKCSFTTDANYNANNLSYQNRKIFQNIKNLYSRREFFAGRKKLFKEAGADLLNLKEKLEEFRTVDRGEQHDKDVQQIEEGLKFIQHSNEKVKELENQIDKFRTIQYQNQQKRKSFWYQHNSLLASMKKTQKIVKVQMVQTIISLILAYQKIKLQPWGHRSNLKNAIFMLMILQAQNTETIHKNDMAIIKQQLSNMIKLGLGWKSQQLQAFFNNYTQIHLQEVAIGLCELQSQAVLSDNPDKQQICIQINGGDNQNPPQQKQAEKDEYILQNSKQVPADDDEQARSKLIESERHSDSNYPVIKICDPSSTVEPKVSQSFDFQLLESAGGQNKKNVGVEREQLVVETFSEENIE